MPLLPSRQLAENLDSRISPRRSSGRTPCYQETPPDTCTSATGVPTVTQIPSRHRFRPAYDFDYVALDVLTVYPEDSGVYTCHARNAYGEAVSSATIKVIGEYN